MDLVVVDSAAALVPRLELEAGIGSDAPGLAQPRAGIGSAEVASTACVRSGACVVFLNQMRNRLEASAGEGETSARRSAAQTFRRRAHRADPVRGGPR